MDKDEFLLMVKPYLNSDIFTVLMENYGEHLINPKSAAQFNKADLLTLQIIRELQEANSLLADLKHLME